MALKSSGEVKLACCKNQAGQVTLIEYQVSLLVPQKNGFTYFRLDTCEAVVLKGKSRWNHNQATLHVPACLQTPQPRIAARLPYTNFTMNGGNKLNCKRSISKYLPRESTAMLSPSPIGKGRVTE